MPKLTNAHMFCCSVGEGEHHCKHRGGILVVKISNNPAVTLKNMFSIA